MLWSFGTFSPVLVFCAKKIWQPWQQQRQFLPEYAFFVKKAQPILCPKSYLSCTVEKSSPIICATFIIFKKLPKENNRP
jgi:hypothetical protein